MGPENKRNLRILGSFCWDMMEPENEFSVPLETMEPENKFSVPY